MKDCLPSSSLAAVSIVSTTRNTLLVLTKALLIGVLLLSYPVFSAPEDRGIFDYADTYFYPVNNNDQIPWGIVTTLMQDHEGYVWVGTQKGAMRFDGYQFQYHEPRPDENGHLAYPWVETFAELAPGEIWIGARRGLAVLVFPTKSRHPNYAAFAAISSNATGLMSSFAECLLLRL